MSRYMGQLGKVSQKKCEKMWWFAKPGAGGGGHPEPNSIFEEMVFQDHSRTPKTCFTLGLECMWFSIKPWIGFKVEQTSCILKKICYSLSDIKIKIFLDGTKCKICFVHQWFCKRPNLLLNFFGNLPLIKLLHCIIIDIKAISSAFSISLNLSNYIFALSTFFLHHLASSQRKLKNCQCGLPDAGF